MAQYKVIYRDENLGWQPGCPILIEAVQVSRNVDTSQCYLQLKVKNISGDAIDKVVIPLVVTTPQGETEAATFNSLDANIRPGAEWKPSAKALKALEVAKIDARVSVAGSLDAFADIAPLPKPEPLDLSDGAKRIRDAEIRKDGVKPELLVGRAEDNGRWWLCSCGAANVERGKCHRCGATKGKAEYWNDTNRYEASFEKQKQQALESARGILGIKGSDSGSAAPVAKAAEPEEVIVATPIDDNEPEVDNGWVCLNCGARVNADDDTCPFCHQAKEAPRPKKYDTVVSLKKGASSPMMPSDSETAYAHDDEEDPAGEEWVCTCGAINFSGDICSGCGVSKRAALEYGVNLSAEAEGEDAEWTCTCGLVNSFDEDVCSSCGAPKPTGEQGEDIDEQDGPESEHKYSAAAIVPKATQETERAAIEASKPQATKAAKTDLSELESARAAILALGNTEESKDLLTKLDGQIAIAKKKQRNRNIAIGSAVCALVAFAIVFVTVIIPSNKYNGALEMAQRGEYDEAIAVLTELGDYKDAKEKIPEVKVEKAIALIKQGDFDKARELKKELDKAKVPTDRIATAYLDGVASVVRRGSYDEAARLLGYLSQSDSKVKAAYGNLADGLFGAGRYDDAVSNYRIAGNDAGIYKCGIKYTEKEEFVKAADLLAELVKKGYPGAEDALNEAEYGYVIGHLDNTDPTTGKYLADLSAKDYRDAASLCSKMYVLRVSFVGLSNSQIGKYNNVTFKYQVTGCIPGKADTRTITIYDTIHKESKKVTLKSSQDGTYQGSLLMSAKISGGPHSATITITDSQTGKVLLRKTVYW